MHNPEQLTQLVAAMIASGDHKINSVQDDASYALSLTNKAREFAYEINKFYCACGDIIAPDHVEYADTVANGCCSGCEAGDGDINTTVWMAETDAGKGIIVEVSASSKPYEVFLHAKSSLAEHQGVDVDQIHIKNLRRVS